MITSTGSHADESGLRRPDVTRRDASSRCPAGHVPVALGPQARHPDVVTPRGRAAVLMLALLCAVGGCTGESDNRQSASGTSPSMPVTPTVGSPPSPKPAIPGWATRCMPAKKSYRLGVAAQYVGLTRDQALRRAQQRGDNLYLVGSAGRCTAFGDAVVQSCKVAVVYDLAPRRRLDLPIWYRLPPSARIVAAERVSGYWDRGGSISKRPSHLCVPTS